MRIHHCRHKIKEVHNMLFVTSIVAYAAENCIVIIKDSCWSSFASIVTDRTRLMSYLNVNTMLLLSKYCNRCAVASTFSKARHFGAR